jgi:hypothetical protein
LAAGICEPLLGKHRMKEMGRPPRRVEEGEADKPGQRVIPRALPQGDPLPDAGQIIRE